MSIRTVVTAVTGICWLAGCGGSGGNSPVAPSTPPPPAMTDISAVQGSGRSSPLEGEAVTVAGIVTGDFQSGDADPRSLRGFYIQSDTPDGDPATSDGLFIFEPSGMIIDVDVGDRVEVDGDVEEFFGETQIEANAIRIVGSGSITPTPLALPVATTTNSDGQPIADLEYLEGMLVRLDQGMFVSDLFSLEEYGEVNLHADERPYQFTNQSAPQVAGYTAHVESRAGASLILDDGDSRQYFAPIHYLYPDPAGNPSRSIRLGDTLTGIEGNVRYSRGSGGGGSEAFRIAAMERPEVSATNDRPVDPPDVGGSFTVGSINLLNYFEGLDDGGDNCGPRTNDGCRGADSTQEFQRQEQKLVAAINAMDADVVGVVEVENNGDDALQSLVDALNLDAGETRWALVPTGSIGDDAIRVGLIYRPASAALSGGYKILDGSVDSRFNDDRNRPVLLQAFTQVGSDAKINVAVAHLKSKGSPCTDIGDPNTNDGQGNCNDTRTSAAAAVADWMLTDPAGSGDADSILVGDLNAYLQEDPLAALEAAGMTSLLASEVGTDAYSFAFRGELGALDHAVVSASLLGQVTGAAEWHIKADEPRVLDYNLENSRDPALFEPTSPYRSSDHDPLIVGFELNTN